jgi:hypothetical protein
VNFNKPENFLRKTLKLLAPMNRVTILLFAVLAAFVFITGVAAQEDEIVDLEEFDILEHEALMIRLQNTFRVELRVLEGYVAAGYSPGQLWLALEIARERNISLDETLVLAEGSDGHGWGVLAQKLGIDPGSSEFHALKTRWTERKGAMIGELKREGEGGIKPDTPNKPELPRDSVKSEKPDSPGSKAQASGNAPESSSGNSNLSGQGGKK